MKNANIELHLHPFICKNTIVDVVESMDKNNLDIVALESLDDSLYPYTIKEAEKYYEKSTHDKSGIKLPSGKYILNAREYNTKENLHLLTVGYSFDEAKPSTEIRKVIDKSLENDALVLLDHPFVDNGKTLTAGHISGEKERFLENLCKEYSGKIALEWNGYCIPWMRVGLKNLLNLFGQNVSYHDVNKKVDELSGNLRKQGYNIPVLADTDLHARTRGQLSAIGTARFITDAEGESASEVVSSMKNNIFAGNYQNVKNYVSSAHLLGAFCLPILLPKHFKKPRA